jgi:hypothetical protein
MNGGDRPRLRPILAAALVAAAVSGAPSTVWALATGADPLSAARAAGTLVAPTRERGSLLVGGVVHGVISVGWTAILAAVLPPRRRAWWGAGAGAGIAVLDLGVIGRRFPQIRQLPWIPQLADHIAFGLLVGLVLDRQPSIELGGPLSPAPRWPHAPRPRGTRPRTR